MIGNPRCQCGERLSAHPLAAGHGFQVRLSRRTGLTSKSRKSRHKKRRGPIDELAERLGIRRSRTMGAYKARLWALFSPSIRQRDADPVTGLVKCVSCPEVKHWTAMDCGHFMPKSLGLAVYFEEKNCSAQCSTCNLTYQGNQHPYALALIEKYGPGIVDELKALAKTTRKISEIEYLELIAYYQAKVRAPKSDSANFI